MFPAIDANGVNVATGAFTYSQTDVTIGQPGQGGLSLSRSYRSDGYWSYNHIGYATGSGYTCSVVIGTATATFTSTGYNCTGTFTSNQAMGETLVDNGSTLTYTLRDGTVATFQRPTPSGTNVHVIYLYIPENAAYLKSITRPAGDTTYYGYEQSGPVCYPDPSYCWVAFYYGRLQSVYSHSGYELYFDYPSPPASMAQANRVTGINFAEEYCVPGACSHNWPNIDYTYNGSGYLATVTNAEGDTTSYTYTSAKLTEVQFPDHANHDINITYASGRVATINPASSTGTWSYSYADANGKRTKPGYRGQYTYFLSITTAFWSGFFGSIRVSQRNSATFMT